MRKEVVVVAAVAAAVGVAVVVSQWKRRRERRWRQTQRILRKFARECATPVPKLWHVTNDLALEMQSGLMASSSVDDDHDLTKLGMLELFDYIALRLSVFISTHSESTEDASSNQRKLGFTISFPVDQVSASSGTGIKWKSLSVDDTVEFPQPFMSLSVGKELVDEMNQALEKHGVDMRVLALVDEAIGDLAGGRYYKKETFAAISLGMGTNAAYIESAQAVPKWDNPSPKSGELIFEKLISGMYLGEVVRRVLLKMAKETALFGETIPSKLAVPYVLRSPDMAAMHQDTSEDHEVVDEKLREIFRITNSTPMVREVVAEVCDIVAERGARLAGAGIVGIIKNLGRIANKRSVVTVEGGLYEHYRVFRNYLHSSVWEMLGNELSDNVIIEHSHGGSGAGSLFLAASQTQNADFSTQSADFRAS
ncbi:hypothetical protein C3L33_18556, partial [Rhododendron williamsianum]